MAQKLRWPADLVSVRVLVLECCNMLHVWKTMPFQKGCVVRPQFVMININVLMLSTVYITVIHVPLTVGRTTIVATAHQTD